MKASIKVEYWLLASRPKTLLAAFVPVTVGSSIAAFESQFKFLPALVALICAILIQVGTNFTNDLYDFLKGADNLNRKGPQRVLSAGLISKKEMLIAVWIVFFSAFILGLYLVYIGGVVILIIGVLSILAGLAYTAGPFPLAYNGLGDIFVFIFFGLAGTIGTYYVQTHHISAIALAASIPVGALITNILIVNNYRDYDEDKAAGKNTLVVLLGKNFSRYEFIILTFVSFLTPLFIYLSFEIDYWIFLPYLSLPIAYKLVKMIYAYDGIELNSTLELSAKFSALFGVLFSLGFIL